MIFFLWQQAPEIAEVAEAAEHGGGHEGGAPHLINVVAVLLQKYAPDWSDWVNVIYSGIIMALVVLFFWIVARNLDKNPGRRQNFVEMLFGWLESFVTDLLGSRGRKYIPLVGSLFIYILMMNFFGLVPYIGHSPSSNLNITLSLPFLFLLQCNYMGYAIWGLSATLRILPIFRPTASRI